MQQVTDEKKALIDDAKKMITAIRQMEGSLDENKRRRGSDDEDNLKITYPLVRCLQQLKETHSHVKRLHLERFEQVKSEHPPFFLVAGPLKVLC